jgi:hypothetical protein
MVGLKYRNCAMIECHARALRTEFSHISKNRGAKVWRAGTIFQESCSALNVFVSCLDREPINSLAHETIDWENKRAEKLRGDYLTVLKVKYRL